MPPVFLGRDPRRTQGLAEGNSSLASREAAEAKEARVKACQRAEEAEAQVSIVVERERERPGFGERLDRAVVGVVWPTTLLLIVVVVADVVLVFRRP